MKFTKKDKKIIILSTVLVLLSGVVLYLILNSYAVHNNLLPETVVIIRDIFQIIFFAVIMIVTILSYNQAKKTLFTPIRTETFKIQIKLFEEILAFFQNKSEMDFREDLGFNDLLWHNGSLLYYRYIETFFNDDLKFDKKLIEDLNRKSKGMIPGSNWQGRSMRKAELFFPERKDMATGKMSDKEKIKQKWKEEMVGVAHTVDSYDNAIEKLNNMTSSPLLPIGLKTLLLDFKEMLISNAKYLADFLDTVSVKMLDLFPTKETLDNFNLYGLSNDYNSGCRPVESKSKEILKYISDYLKIEEINK